MDPLLETLEGAVQRLRQPPSVAAEVEKIREQLAEHRAQGLELDKLLPSFSALCARGEELIGRAAHDDPAAQGERLSRQRLLERFSRWRYMWCWPLVAISSPPLCWPWGCQLQHHYPWLPRDIIKGQFALFLCELQVIVQVKDDLYFY